MSKTQAALHWLKSSRPIAVSAVLGLLMSSGMFFQPISAEAQVRLSLGLFTTYVSIGVLVALLPTIGPRWLFGLAVGLIYSIPGAIFTTVPYPLRHDAASIWRDFAGGNSWTFFVTLLAGAFVGVVSALYKPRRKPLPDGMIGSTKK